jgi:hypothetical protein
MNKQFGSLFACVFILTLTLVLSGCAPAPTATPAPASLRAPTPTATATKAATLTPVPTPTLTPPPPTATKPAPTITPTLPPSATATKAAPTAAPSGVPAGSPTAPSGATATPAAPLPPSGSATCLACHGPYAKVVAASAGYKTSDGKSVNPHTTVDQSKPKVSAHLPGTGAPPECFMCHEPHPLVAAPVVDLSTVTVKYCFVLCHHERDFRPCKECHG